MYLKSQTKYTEKVEHTIADNFNCQWLKYVICRARNWPYSLQCEMANKHKKPVQHTCRDILSKMWITCKFVDYDENVFKICK